MARSAIPAQTLLKPGWNFIPTYAVFESRIPTAFGIKQPIG